MFSLPHFWRTLSSLAVHRVCSNSRFVVLTKCLESFSSSKDVKILPFPYHHNVHLNQSSSPAPPPLYLVLPVLPLFLSPLVTCPALCIYTVTYMYILYICIKIKHNLPPVDKFSSPITALKLNEPSLIMILVTYIYSHVPMPTTV